MMTVKQLIETLSTYNENAEVRFFNGEPIRHIARSDEHSEEYSLILSDEVPTKICNVCDNFVYTECVVGGYPYYCPCCDENKYEHEVSDRQ